jgi:hypothetical protein
MIALVFETRATKRKGRLLSYKPRGKPTDSYATSTDVTNWG